MDTKTAEQQRLALKSTELLRQAAYIDGQWVEAAGTLEVLNPATLQLLGRVPALGAAQTERAVAAAQRAFGPWRGLAAGDRGAILQRWFELMLANQEDLARLMTAEQGKPLSESRGEITYAFDALGIQKQFGGTERGFTSPQTCQKVTVRWSGGDIGGV